MSLVFVGLLLGIIAYSALYLGKGFQKLAIEGIKEKSIKSRHTWVWIAGTTLNAVYMFLQWAALKFAPINIIAPMDGAGLIVLLFFSFYILKERITKNQLYGVFLIAAGTIVIPLFNITANSLRVTDFNLVRYITLSAGVLALEAAAIITSKLMQGKGFGIVIGLTAGTFLAFETVAKRITAIPDLKINLIFSVVTFIVSGVGFMATQYALAKADANTAVPCFTSASITIATLMGFFVLHEKIHPITIVGIATVVTGIFFLTSGRAGSDVHAGKKNIREFQIT